MIETEGESVKRERCTAVRCHTRDEVVTSRWPDPATSSVDLGVPQVR